MRGPPMVNMEKRLSLICWGSWATGVSAAWLMASAIASRVSA